MGETGLEELRVRVYRYSFSAFQKGGQASRVIGMRVAQYERVQRLGADTCQLEVVQEDRSAGAGVE
jgi:hypothetical protein